MSPSDTELEPRLIETLRAKAAQIPDVMAPFERDVVNLSADRGRGSKPRRLVAAAVVVVLVIVAAVALVIAFGDRKGAKPAGRPAETPDARLAIEALPTLQFQADDFTTEAGVNEITFTSFGGTHRLVFADPALGGFALDVSNPGVPSRGFVPLDQDPDTAPLISSTTLPPTNTSTIPLSPSSP